MKTKNKYVWSKWHKTKIPLSRAVKKKSKGRSMLVCGTRVVGTQQTMQTLAEHW